MRDAEEICDLRCLFYIYCSILRMQPLCWVEVGPMRRNGVRSRGIEFQLAFCLASLSASSLLRTILCAQTFWIMILYIIF